MKRRLMASVFAALLLTGCTEGNGIEVEGLNSHADGRFAYEQVVAPDSSEYEFGYVVDTETGVTYLVMRQGRGKSSWGGITSLLDSDGKPIINDRYDEVDE